MNSAAVVNGTLYMYGFRTSNDSQQKSNTWSKLFPGYHRVTMLIANYSQRLPLH